MSFAAAGGADIVRVIDGNEYRFKRPTRNQVGQFLASWAANDRSRIAELLEQSGAPPEFRFTVLRRHDEESRRMGWGVESLFEFTRSIEVVQAAFGKPIDAIPLAPDEIVRLACELWGFGNLFCKPTDTEVSGPLGRSAESGAAAANPIGSSTTLS